jgi:hypothetical protein
MANELEEQRIRERAYELWQQDGAPEGRADEYWEKAQRQVLAESSGTSAPIEEPEALEGKDTVSGENGAQNR